jgi:CRP-like cAMP-binding protein
VSAPAAVRGLAPAPAPPARGVALLRADRGLRAAVPEADRSRAERALVVPGRRLTGGGWSPERLVPGPRQPFASLILRGVVVHETLLGGRASADLLGAGDIITRSPAAAGPEPPSRPRWAAGTGVEVALLGERFISAARYWPGLNSVVHERLARQLEAAAVRTAITGLPRGEERVLALLWQLAGRWGSEGPDGITIHLGLTHELMGRLIGTRRPTVTLALHSLAADGLVLPARRGGWMLTPGSADALDLPVGDRIVCPSGLRPLGAH